MKTDETNPRDWFLLARERLEAADAVHRDSQARFSAIELLQGALERYLKGYLISTGWPLRRIHNLSTLLDHAVQADSRFKAFADLCDSLTAQFWEQHYPGGDLTDVGTDYVLLRQQTGDMIALIESLVPEHFTAS